MTYLTNGKYSVTFPSSPDYLEEAEAITSKIAKEARFEASAVDDISIAVTELFNNAVHHGNKNNISKKVVLTYRLDEKGLTVSIKDEGKGFEPEELRDPLAPENLLAESGRGIYLVKHLMDDVRFNITESGSEITVFKALPGVK